VSVTPNNNVDGGGEPEKHSSLAEMEVFKNGSSCEKHQQDMPIRFPLGTAAQNAGEGRVNRIRPYGSQLSNSSKQVEGGRNTTEEPAPNKAIDLTQMAG